MLILIGDRGMLILIEDIDILTLICHSSHYSTMVILITPRSSVAKREEEVEPEGMTWKLGFDS